MYKWYLNESALNVDVTGFVKHEQFVAALVYFILDDRILS